MNEMVQEQEEIPTKEKETLREDSPVVDVTVQQNESTSLNFNKFNFVKRRDRKTFVTVAPAASTHLKKFHLRDDKVVPTACYSYTVTSGLIISTSERCKYVRMHRVEI